MQSFGTLLSDNKGLAVALAIVVTVLVIAVLTFLYRLLFGRRLHMTGGRSRQPRLGVVDAFDLDRQRQLVLVRRDNVEHLLMIGGPNDLVIESAFQRAQPSLAVPAARDKEAAVAAAPVVPMPLPPQTPVLEAPAPASLPPAIAEAPPSRAASPPLDLIEPVTPGDLGPLTDLPAPGPVPAVPDNGPPVATPPASAATPAADAVTPRPNPSRFAQTSTPRPAPTTLPPRPPLTSLRTPTTNGAALPPAARTPTTLPNRPTPLAPLQRGTSAASLRRDPPMPPSAEPAPPTAAPEPQPPATMPDAPAQLPDVRLRPTLPLTLDSIESLEEEMAKLLGRAAAANAEKK